MSDVAVSRRPSPATVVAVSIACLDPIAVCARSRPSLRVVRGPTVSSVWGHGDACNGDRIVNDKTCAPSTVRLESDSNGPEILALLRLQYVQFLYGAVRNALGHIRQNRLNGLEQITACDLSATNSRTVSRHRQSAVRTTNRWRRCTAVCSQWTVHVGASQFTPDHFRPPRATNTHRASSVVVERHWQGDRHVLVRIA